MSAIELLEKAAGHLKDRAAMYDKPEGERSMGATVAAFEAVTGHQLTEEQGWLFMALLKAVRTQQGNYRADNYEDGAAYFALMGESACEERNGGWTPQEIEAAAFDTGIPVSAAFKDACDSAEVEWPDESRIDVIGQNGNDGAVYSECNLQEVIVAVALPEWARWVAVDGDGKAYAFSKKPALDCEFSLWDNVFGSKYTHLIDLAPPLDFKTCIWELK